MTVRHDRRPELPLYTVRFVGAVRATDEEDTRRFWTHRESLEKRKHRCCVQWDRNKRLWIPTESPCPAGAHDFATATMDVVYAHTGQPWKRAPKHINPKNRPNITLLIRGEGVTARQIYLAEPKTKFLIGGHVTTYYNFGRFWQTVNVFDLKEVTENQIKSQLSTILFNQFRQAVQEIAKPVEAPRPFEDSFVTQVRSRRDAARRGEVLPE